MLYNIEFFFHFFKKEKVPVETRGCLYKRNTQHAHKPKALYISLPIPIIGDNMDQTEKRNVIRVSWVFIITSWVFIITLTIIAIVTGVK